MFRRSLPLGFVLTGSLLLAAAVSFAAGASSEMKPAHAGGAKGDMVARGRYLTTVAGCNDCHTPGTLYGAPDFDRQLSGSDVGWKGPWGISFARNLTPDPETGLGTWSEEDIIKAFRSGVRKDGRMLNPPMPWQMFAAFSDEDAHAIAAFLKSLPPVKHAVHDVVPPGQDFAGAAIPFPPPPAWDAPRSAPGGAPGGAPPAGSTQK